MKFTGAWLAVALLWITAALNYVDRQVIFSLFPLLERDLAISSVQLGFLATAFLWIYGLASPFGGYLADRVSRKQVIVGSLAVWSLVTWGTAHVSGYGQLAAMRGAMGISEALYLPAALALIADLHPESTRALAIGLHQSGLYAGIVLGGWGGGWIGERYGWRSAFSLLGAIGVVYGIVLVLGLRGGSRKGAGREPAPSFASACTELLGSPAFRLVLVANGLTSVAYWCVYTWLPTFLFDRFQMSLSGAGFSATFYIQAASLAGVVAGGFFADRWVGHNPRARIYTQILGVCTAGPAVFLIGITGSQTVLVAALVAFGLGRGFFDCNLMPVLCQILSSRLRATAYGFLNLVSCVLGGIMAVAGGALRDTLGLGRALELSGLMLLLAALLLARLRNR